MMVALFPSPSPGIHDCCMQRPRNEITGVLLAKKRGYTGLIWMRISVSKTCLWGNHPAKVRVHSSDGSKNGRRSDETRGEVGAAQYGRGIYEKIFGNFDCYPLSRNIFLYGQVTRDMEREKVTASQDAK